MELILIGTLIIILLFLTFLPMLHEIKNRHFDIFNFKNFFIIYYSSQFVIHTIYLLLSDIPKIPWLSIYYEENLFYYVKALLLVNIGLIFFYFGYYLHFGNIFIKLLPKITPWVLLNAHIIGFSYIFIGFLVFYIFIEKYGGLISFWEQLGYWRSLGLVGEGIFTFPVNTIFSTGALIIFLISCIKKNNKFYKILSLLLILLSFALTLFLGFRIIFGIIFLQFLACWHFLKTPISLKGLILIMVCIILLLTGYGLARQTIEIYGPMQASILSYTFRDEDFYSLLIAPLIGRTCATEIVVATLQAIERGQSDFKSPHHSLFEALTIIIPRALWEGKPRGKMLEFGAEVMGEYLIWREKGIMPEATGGTSPTAVGFFYWYLGTLGVFTGMFIIGVIFRAVYQFLKINNKNPSRVLIYSIIGANLVIFAESPQDSLNHLIPKLILLFITIFLITAKLDH